MRGLAPLALRGLAAHMCTPKDLSWALIPQALFLFMDYLPLLQYHILHLFLLAHQLFQTGLS